MSEIAEREKQNRPPQEDSIRGLNRVDNEWCA
jgi:hypothetical protein